jgi:hypothetical protein
LDVSVEVDFSADDRAALGLAVELAGECIALLLDAEFDVLGGGIRDSLGL